MSIFIVYDNFTYFRICISCYKFHTTFFIIINYLFLSTFLRLSIVLSNGQQYETPESRTVFMPMADHLQNMEDRSENPSGLER